MNDYAYHQAETSGSLEGTGILAKFISNWRARRTVKQLWQMDDHLLNDMGLTRDEIAWAAHRPLFENAVMALEERSMSRRAANLSKPRSGRLL